MTEPYLPLIENKVGNCLDANKFMDFHSHLEENISS